MDAILDRLKDYLRDRSPPARHALEQAVAADTAATAAAAFARHQAGHSEEALILYLGLVDHWGPGNGVTLFSNIAAIHCQRADYEGAWRWVRRGLLHDPVEGAEMAYKLAKTAQFAGSHDIFWHAIGSARALDPDSIRYWSTVYVEHAFRGMPGTGKAPVAGIAPAPGSPTDPAMARQVQPSGGNDAVAMPGRIALVGRDFGNVASFNRLLHPFMRLPQHGFDLVCISVRDSFTPEAAHFPGLRYVSAPERDPQALVRTLCEEQVEIAIDLVSHGTPEVFAAYAARPVPLIVGWSGSGISSGIDAFDAFLTDSRLCPAGAEAHYTEPVLRLPGTSITVEPYPEYPDSKTLPADQNGLVTFGSFHRLSKVTPAVIDLWAQILERVRGSRLLLKTAYLDDPAIAGRIRSRFESHGIDGHRLTLTGLTDAQHHCRIVATADIALAPFPEQGLVTDFDSFWMGIPTVGLEVDDRPCARLTGMLATAAGAPFLATVSPEAFVETATALAADLPYLRAARRHYRGNMVAAGITDHDRAARSIAAALSSLRADKGLT